MNSDDTPQEIHERNERKRMQSKAVDLRHKLEIRGRFKSLPSSTRAAIRIDLLKSLGFDPLKPLSEQSLKIRLVYYNNKSGLRSLVEFYEKNIERYEMKSPFD